ncbi:phosphate ABC transporter ATP-binding protein [Thermococci archaeon]|nr:MAG: phosphate ABC transporter ATP-binding protein [Thermococci archaeon]
MDCKKDQLNNHSAKLVVENLNVYYHDRHVLKDISIRVQKASLTCIVGPSGCGKSSLLMAINRLLDAIPHARAEGKIRVRFDGDEWLDVLRVRETMLPDLRRRIGLVFQHPNILPTSILKNMVFPLKLLSLTKEQSESKIRRALEMVYLWDEIKDRLDSPATELSGGQQQRLCIARMLVLEPEILLLDEPTSFLDEVLARKIESLLLELKEKCTVIVVSHYWEQIRRLADQVYRLG